MDKPEINGRIAIPIDAGIVSIADALRVAWQSGGKFTRELSLNRILTISDEFVSDMGQAMIIEVKQVSAKRSES